MHTICPSLLKRSIHIVVVGCGGTGSAIASGLPYLHQSMLATGHPGGLDVTLIDGDRISATNCVRQPFSEGEIGLFKSVVLVRRLNLFWNLEWKAVPKHLDRSMGLPHPTDFIIGCVDSRAARAVINDLIGQRWTDVRYWLDIGNNAESGQFVLGQPLNGRNRRRAQRLRTIAELFPEIVDPSLDDRSQPSCSAAEALDRQHPFINQTLANHALALLSRLFRHGSVGYHGGFLSLSSGSSLGLRAEPAVWKRLIARNRKKLPPRIDRPAGSSVLN